MICFEDQAYQMQEREAFQFAEKQTSGGDNNNLTSITQQGKGSSKKRFRKKGASRDSEDDDEEPTIKRNERNIRSRKSKAEEDDFELTEPKLSKKDKEVIIWISKALEENYTSDLREVSRQVYLQKRRDQKLLEIQDGIIDHEYIFEGVKLAEAEEREMRYKKKIYELAKEHLQEEDNNEYRMPEAYDQDGGVNQEKRFAAAMQRYRDPGAGDKMNPFAEQEAWEEHQIGKASLKFGSKDRKQAADDYQYVFEDGINFIKASVMDGIQYEDELPVESPEASIAKSEFQKLQDERKTLPIYPYREKLLQAVNDHQVIIIVGETGSGKDYTDTPVSS